MSNKYQIEKEKARQKAIEWQGDISTYYHDISYSELNYWYDYFTKLGKRYGLLKEFRENGII